MIEYSIEIHSGYWIKQRRFLKDRKEKTVSLSNSIPERWEEINPKQFQKMAKWLFSNNNEAYSRLGVFKEIGGLKSKFFKMLDVEEASALSQEVAWVFNVDQWPAWQASILTRYGIWKAPKNLFSETPIIHYALADTILADAIKDVKHLNTLILLIYKPFGLNISKAPWVGKVFTKLTRRKIKLAMLGNFIFMRNALVIRYPKLHEGTGEKGTYNPFGWDGTLINIAKNSSVFGPYKDVCKTPTPKVMAHLDLNIGQYLEEKRD